MKFPIKLQPLLKIHKSFYEELLKSTEKDCVFDIADVFIKFKEKFLIYGHYCKKLKSVLDLLELLKTSNESFKAHLQVANVHSFVRGHFSFLPPLISTAV